MAEERRRGLSTKEQKEMLDMLRNIDKRVDKLDTHLLGPNGNDGILSQFKNNDDDLFRRMGKIERKWWYVAGAIGIIAFIAPFVADKLF